MSDPYVVLGSVADRRSDHLHTIFNGTCSKIEDLVREQVVDVTKQVERPPRVCINWAKTNAASQIASFRVLTLTGYSSCRWVW